MFNFFKKQHGTGLLPDIRSQEDKSKDYQAKEVRVFKAVNWIEKPQKDWRRFPISNQEQASNCVNHALAKVLGVENYLEEKKFIDFSKRDIYSQGFEPTGGMVYDKALSLVKNNGITLESLMPSLHMTEEEVRKRDDASNFTRQVALVGKPKNYIYLPIDIDAIAEIIDSGKAVCLGTRFNTGGFTPEVKLDQLGMYGHAISGTDRTIWKDEKAIIFDNSWDYSWGFDGQGILTESQLKNGLVTAAYFEDLSNNWRDVVIVKPKFTFTKNLSLGMTDPEVVKLQDCLAYEGLFTTASTGYFGPITKNAVVAFQAKYGIDQVGTVGPITRAKLNELYSG